MKKEEKTTCKRKEIMIRVTITKSHEATVRGTLGAVAIVELSTTRGVSYVLNIV